MIEQYNILWVGLSDKENTEPLSSSTASGKLIQKVEEIIGEEGYKTNLVPFPPLDENGKLRYPNSNEMEKGMTQLLKTIDIVNPKIILLLGKQTATFVFKQLQVQPIWWDNYKYFITMAGERKYIAIHHPSYINVYKKKDIPEYIDGLSAIINKFINEERK